MPGPFGGGGWLCGFFGTHRFVIGSHSWSGPQLLELLNGVCALPFMSGRKFPVLDVPFVRAEPRAGWFDAVANTLGCAFRADVLDDDFAVDVVGVAGLATRADFCDPPWLGLGDCLRLEVLDRLGLVSAELGRVVLQAEGVLLRPLHGLGLEP